MTVLPLFVNDTERNILVGRTGSEDQEACIRIVLGSDEFVGRSFRLVAATAKHKVASVRANTDLVLKHLHEIWVEDVEFVTLYNLWRGVVGTDDDNISHSLVR
jgi:hypothetical protein